MHLQPFVYRNVRFRSKVAAEMAWWLDRFELPWAYEPETFVEGKVKVTPDFWLPDIQTMVFVQTRILASHSLEDSLKLVGALSSRAVFLEMDRHVIGPMTEVPDPARLVTCWEGLFPTEPASVCAFAEPNGRWFWHGRFVKSVAHIKQLSGGAHVLLVRCSVCGAVHWIHRAGDTICPRCRLGRSVQPAKWQKHITPALRLRPMEEVLLLVEQARVISGV